jgi:ABC-type uncharacterized transport system ATPase subunit
MVPVKAVSLAERAELDRSGMKPVSALALRNVTKRFGAFHALTDVSLDVRPGEVHCLLGENGAGKSTLCNVIFGVHRPDEGSLHFLGAPFEPRGPAHALSAGVAMVHQHFSLVGDMTPIENMMLGRVRGRLDTRGFEARASALSERYGLVVDLKRKIADLSIGERQRVEVLKCLLEEPKLLVLDEPTAVLPPREVASLLEVVRRVAKGGCGVLLVTHKLAEIRAIADRTSVLRRGKVVETVDMANADLPALVRAMVGREVKPLTEAAGVTRATVTSTEAAALEVTDLTAKDDHGVTRLEVSLTVHAGEIVGLAGVEGNGQSELGDILAGLRAADHGSFRVGGKDATGKSPRELTALGVGIVPEDRHATACHVDLTVAENLYLERLGDFTRFGLLDRKRLDAQAASRIDVFDVRGNARMRFGDLSGGNQQKVVLARELGKNPLKFLLAAQPTRGLDVGAVEAVYSHLRAARDRGVGVLLVSSELEEVLSVADRVLVIYRGRIVGEVPGSPSEMERVGTLMSGRFLKEIAS